MHITMGSLLPGGIQRASSMKAIPWEADAVKTLAPAAEAPQAAAIAVCSPSTLMYWASIFPSAMRVAMWLMSSVWGVIG
jgi:hypothetical protein